MNTLPFGALIVALPVKEIALFNVTELEACNVTPFTTKFPAPSALELLTNKLDPLLREVPVVITLDWLKL